MGSSWGFLARFEAPHDGRCCGCKREGNACAIGVVAVWRSKTSAWQITPRRALAAYRRLEQKYASIVRGRQALRCSPRIGRGRMGRPTWGSALTTAPTRRDYVPIRAAPGELLWGSTHRLLRMARLARVAFLKDSIDACRSTTDSVRPGKWTPVQKFGLHNVNVNS